MRLTIASYLDDFLLRGNETAFACRQGLRIKRWSYTEITETAFRFARELEARRIEKGDRVLFWARNSPEWVSAFLGCLLRGAIAVPLDSQSELSFIKRVQEQVDAKLALCDAATNGLIEQTLPAIVLDQLTLRISHHAAQAYPFANIGTDDVAEIVFTSGTTAEPKGVRITHRNLLANLTPLEREIAHYLKWERLVHPIRFLTLVPLSHVFGQFMGIFVPQLLGGEVFFQESLLPSQIIETVKRERISVIVCVPRSLDTLREKLERDYQGRRQLTKFQRQFERAAESNFIWRWWTFRRVHQMLGWKFWAFISGGAKLNPDTEEFWQRLGFAVIQGYGMTETAALVSVNHPFKRTRGSIGRVLPGQQVKLAENGEILVSGENVSPGYWNDDGRLEAAEHGWFRTGDAGELDAAGNLYFKGRKKEVIVTSAGMNIYPEDIELVLNRQPEIKTSAVIEIDGPHGPEPMAVLILRDDKEGAGAAIDRANKSLAQHQQLRRWAIWPEAEFPFTTTQKVRKQVIMEWMKESSGTTSAGSFETLEKILSQVSGDVAQEFVPSARLGPDLKLDSLGRVELLSALEDSYQVELDEAALTEETTLGDVRKLVRESKREAAAPYPYPRWQQRWPMSWLRIVLLYLIVLPLTRIMGRVEIRGATNLHDLSGPFVFICNHVSMVDHALVLLALPGSIRRNLAIAMDGELLREWRHTPAGTKLLTRLLHLLEYLLVVLFFNVFSMPRKTGFRRSFAFAGELMDRGYSILIFPEGQRTKHGQMNPFFPGTGLLVSQLDASVVPMRIDGLWELKQANKHLARAGDIALIIGKPLRFSSRTAPDVIAQELERQVRAL
jgi:long-chain acyl-CoA synthetase